MANEIPKELDELVMKALDRDPVRRWSSAREMALALETVLAPAPSDEIGHWVRAAGGERLARQAERARHHLARISVIPKS